MNSITQDMKYRQSLMKYAEKYGVSKASRKYNKARSYIYFWKNRWDGSVESLATQSRRPHHHPNQHTDEEIKLIRNHHRRNPDLELPELWHRLRKKGYSRRIESLYRVMKKLGMLPQKPEKEKRIPDSAKLKTPQRVSKKSESSHYIFREQGGVYEREQ